MIHVYDLPKIAYFRLNAKIFFKTQQKAILGSDCALDLNSVEDICDNLKRFFQWSTRSCRAGEKRIRNLEKKCNEVKNVKLLIELA